MNVWRKKLLAWVAEHRKLGHDVWYGLNFGICRECREHVNCRMDNGELRIREDA